MQVKHSIVMICYNQEQYIKTALDSVLCEQVKPYEIIIGDDYSTDGTRAILEGYKSKYPEIIKLVLNGKNIGIFANLNNVTPKTTGDIISFLSGDDWYRPNFLESMNKKIAELKLDPMNSRFILLPHVVNHQPDGTEIILRNDPNMLRHYSPNGLAMRGKLFKRDVGISRALFDKYPLFECDSQDIGPWADFVHSTMFVQYYDQVIVMDSEGPVYRTGVGFVSKTGLKALDRSYHAALVRTQTYHLKGELILSDVDAKFLEFLIQCWAVRIKPSIIGLLRVFLAAWSVIKIRCLEINSVFKVLYRMVRQIVSNGLRRRHKL